MQNVEISFATRRGVVVWGGVVYCFFLLPAGLLPSWLGVVAGCVVVV